MADVPNKMSEQKRAFWNWVVTLPVTDTPRGDFIRDTIDLYEIWYPQLIENWVDKVEERFSGACDEARQEYTKLYLEFSNTTTIKITLHGTPDYVETEWIPTEAEVRSLLEENLWLGRSGDLPGFGTSYDYHKEEKRKESREELIQYRREIGPARYYISLVGRRSIQSSSSSYGWKHVVESYFERYGGGRRYVSNGAFIAACLINGVKIVRKRNSPNPDICFST